MPKNSAIAAILMSLVLGAAVGAAVGGCGEDRDGSVEIEGGTTGTTGTTGTGTTTTP
jgi:hypothetical protein